MLVLSRKKGESLMIGGHTEVVILEVEGDLVKVGICAPREIEVHRKEVYDQIKSANEAAQSTVALPDFMKLAGGVKKKGQ